jgi:Ala-tRNA(Pro) deacylase
VIGRLKQYLEENGVAYEVLAAPGEEAYTAQELAARLHISGRELLKVVIVKADGRPCLAVVPAAKRLDLKKVAELLGAKRASLAPESEFAALFPDCEVGAEPPFGNLYGLETLVDDHFLTQEQVTFLAGSHREAVQMDRGRFEELVRPKVGDFCQPWQ